MSANHKIQKTSGGVVHAGSWMGNEADPRTSKYGYFTPSCGSGVVYAMGSLRNIAGFRELPQDTKVTCKKCLKLIEKAEYLGLHLKVVDNEDGSSKVVDTREEVAPKPEAEAPGVYDHAAAVAQIRANIDAEEEERAAARRARNRTNYAPAPAPREDDTITREPEGRTLTEVEEMEDQYQDLVLIGRGLRLLSDQFCRMLADMKDTEGLAEDHPRRAKMHAKLTKSMDLEDANLKAREALHAEIREARNRGRCLQRGGRGTPLQCLRLRDHSEDCKNSRGETFTNWTDPEEKMYAFGSKPEEKPFHRQVKDAIGLKW